MKAFMYKSFLLPGKHISNSQTTMICIDGNIDFSSKDFDLLAKKYSQYSNLIVFSDEVMEILNGICKWSLPPFPSEAHVKAYKLLTEQISESPNVLPWRIILGNKEYFETCMTYAYKILDSINSKPGTMYAYDVAYKMHHCFVLDSMGECAVNNSKIKKHATDPNTSLSQKEILKTFIGKPTNPYWNASRNLLYPPQSTLAATRTGRAKITSGPNLLHLQKDFRDIIQSRFGDKGNIWYLDYTSLEPRVLLYMAQDNLYKIDENNNAPYATIGNDVVITRDLGSNTSIYSICVPDPKNNNNTAKTFETGVQACANKNDSDGDIYKQFIASHGLTNKNIPRHVIKGAVISVLYGQSEKNFVNSIREYISDPEELYSGVEDFFQLQKIKSFLISELESNNNQYIRNYYGRPIYPEDAKSYALVNYYIQSTAVDVAFFGYQNVLREIKNFKSSEKVIPIFVLHDAILLDVHEDHENIIGKLEQSGSTNILGFENKNFYLRATKIKSEQ